MIFKHFKILLIKTDRLCLDFHSIDSEWFYIKSPLLSIIPIFYMHLLLTMPSSLWITAALSQTTLSPNNNTPRKPRRTNAVLYKCSVHFFHRPLFSTVSTAKTNPKQRRVLRNPPSRGFEVTTGDRGCRELWSSSLSWWTFTFHQAKSVRGNVRLSAASEVRARMETPETTTMDASLFYTRSYHL